MIVDGYPMINGFTLTSFDSLIAVTKIFIICGPTSLFNTEECD